MSHYGGKPSEKGKVQEKKGAIRCGVGFFLLDPCVGDNMGDSPNNRMSSPYMSKFEGARTVHTVEF